MGLLKNDDGWRLLDQIWGQMEPLLPPVSPIRSAVISTGERPCRDECDLVRTAYGLPMECIGRYWHLFEQLGASAIPGMGPGGGI